MNTFIVAEKQMIEHVSPDCECPGKCCKSCTHILCHGKFYKNNKAKDKLQSSCKTCKKNYIDNWRVNNSEHIKAYEKEYISVHKEHRRDVRKRWAQTHKEAVSRHNKTFRTKHATEVKQRKHTYYQSNRKRILLQHKSYYQEHKEERSNYYKSWRKQNAEHVQHMKQKHYQANKEYYLKKTHTYRQTHKEQIRDMQKKYNHLHSEQLKQYHAKYFQENKDRLVSANRSRYFSNHEYWKAFHKHHYHTIRKHQAHYQQLKTKHYQDNREEILNKVRRYRKLNPEISSVAHSKRRSHIIKTGTSFTLQEWKALKAYYHNACLCCRRKESDIKLTADHVVPLSKGGANDISNIQPLCRSCNSRKHTKTIDYRPNWTERASS